MIPFYICAQPDRPDELMRIEEAGGKVINWNGQRVLGVLATSRSIGWFQLIRLLVECVIISQSLKT